RAARLYLQLRHRKREARPGMQNAAAPGGGEIDEVELRVRALQSGARAHEGRALPGADGERPAPEERVVEADLRLAPEAEHVVLQRDRLVGAPESAAVKVVLQPLADL